MPKRRVKKSCIQCQQEFETRREYGETRKIFCSTKCQQHWNYLQRKGRKS